MPWFAIAALVISAVGSIQQGMAAAQAARIEQQNRRADIEAARRKAAFDESRAREAGKRLMATQRARFAAAGVEMLGSPEEIFAETAAETELEALGIRFGFETVRMREEGAIALAGHEAKSAMVAGFLGAGSSAVKGVGIARAREDSTKLPDSTKGAA
jgi:sortase (surface protein transpeptidase)